MDCQTPTGGTRRGMTLLELMIALIVAGIAVTVGYAALTMVADRRMQADTTVAAAMRAAAMRRTLVNWLQHAQLQFQTGPGAPQSVSEFSHRLGGARNDEIRFVTTASTPLRSDSTVVQLYVDGPDGEDASARSFGAPGLKAFLTPTLSAIASRMTAGRGGGSPVGAGVPEKGGVMDDAFVDGAVTVLLDSTVATLHVDYLVLKNDGTQEWVPASTFIVIGNAPIVFITALRLTMVPVSLAAFPAILTLPIVVPVTPRIAGRLQ